MSNNLTEKRQKLKLQLEGKLTEEEIRKRSIHVTKLHIPTIFKSVPDLTNYQGEETEPNKFSLPNNCLNKSTKNVNIIGDMCEESRFLNNHSNYLKPVNKQLSPTSTIFNFRPSKDNTKTPRENTYYEIDSPEHNKPVNLRNGKFFHKLICNNKRLIDLITSACELPCC